MLHIAAGLNWTLVQCAKCRSFAGHWMTHGPLERTLTCLQVDDRVPECLRDRDGARPSDAWDKGPIECANAPLPRSQSRGILVSAMWSRATRTAALICICAGMFVSAVSRSHTQAGEKKIDASSQVEALVAPIALYPDPLLAKILIASTYPLEVTEAANWLQQGSGSSRTPEGVRSQRWDQSIKDIVSVPRVIVAMNDHLDWTQTLGDAFLSDPDAVLSTVQMLRAKAAASGVLRTNEIQKITSTKNGIEIQPVNSDVVRLPTYDPRSLYASPDASSRPQPSWAPPGFTYSAKIVFLPGVAVPAELWDATIEWDRDQIYVSRNLRPGNRGNPMRAADRVAWQHDPEHRRGVNYSTPELRARYGGQSAPGVESRRAFRGLQEPTEGNEQGGLRDAGYHFRKHGGALDGIGDAAQTDNFSRRGHQSMAPASASSKSKPQDVFEP